MLRDLTGKRFGNLIVTGRGEDFISKNGRRRIRWNCICDCGNTKLIYTDNLVRGASLSCGCLRSKIVSERRSTHRESKTLLYGVWSSMKARCLNVNATYYQSYGGRGIKICDEWRNSYETFRDWALHSGYAPGLSIDRIDVNGNYEPLNCRWVSPKEQSNNRRSNILVTHNEQTHNVTEWASILGINPKTIFSRIYSGKAPEAALFNENLTNK